MPKFTDTKSRIHWRSAANSHLTVYWGVRRQPIRTIAAADARPDLDHRRRSPSIAIDFASNRMTPPKKKTKKTKRAAHPAPLAPPCCGLMFSHTPDRPSLAASGFMDSSLEFYCCRFGARGFRTQDCSGTPAVYAGSPKLMVP